jgi:hypothetical protein
MVDQSPSAVDTAHLEFFLAHHGWERIRSDDELSVWSKGEGGLPVRIALGRGRDFDSLMEDAIERVADQESKDIDDLLIEVSWPGFDKLSARTRVEEHSSAVPLHEALSLHGALRDLVVAAARASESPQPSYRGGWSNRVGSYFDQVRMIPSRPGSFTLRALLPLTPDDPDEILFETVDDTSTRDVARTLLRAVESARVTAVEIANGAPIDLMSEVVPLGVSADLLDAMVRLGGSHLTATSVELTLAWTYAAPEEPPNPIVIPAGIMPVLASSAEMLQGAPEEIQAKVSGLVVRLHRAAPVGDGEITIDGFIETNAGSSTRSVRVELHEDLYEQAIQAHRDGVPVHLECVVRLGTRVKVLRVEDFSASNAT